MALFALLLLAAVLGAVVGYCAGVYDSEGQWDEFDDAEDVGTLRVEIEVDTSGFDDAVRRYQRFGARR